MGEVFMEGLGEDAVVVVEDDEEDDEDDDGR